MQRIERSKGLTKVEEGSRKGGSLGWGKAPKSGQGLDGRGSQEPWGWSGKLLNTRQYCPLVSSKGSTAEDKC